MKKITKILILLTIPSISCIMYGLITQKAPFCYPGGTPQAWLGGDVVVSIYFYAACFWGIDAFLQSYLAYTLIITLPIMLGVFLIYYVKNSKKIRVNE